MKKYILWGAGILLSPFVIILLLTIALYIPPIQNWAVDKASEYASEATGMNITVDNVRLAFPLDLSVNGVRVTQQNDSLPQVTDTIAEIDNTIVDVALMPLFHSEVAINAVELNKAKVNTADIIHEARIKGTVGHLALAESVPVADVKLNESWVSLGKAILDDAHLNIELSDTVPEDTTKSEQEWRIHIDDLAVSNSSLLLHMPGDTLQVGMQLSDVKAHNGNFDLKKGLYELASLAVSNSAVQYDNNFIRPLKEGIDANHISLNDVNLRIDSLHFCAPDLRMKIAQCSMKEKSGLQLKSLFADIALDSTQVKVNGTMQTPASSLMTRVAMDLNAFDDNNPGKVKAFIDASLGRQDLMLAMQDMPKSFRSAWPQHALAIKGEAEGNLKEVVIPWLSVDLPTAFSLDAKGNAKGFMSLADNIYSKDFAATLHADMKTYNMSFVKTFLDKSTAKMINIPSVHALADLSIKGADYDVALKATEGKGKVTANAKANLAAMAYDASIKASNLNLGHFVRGMQLGSFTGSMKANGQGTDIKSHSTRSKITAKVDHFSYGKYNLNNITADAGINKGVGSVNVRSKNDLIDGDVNLDALLNSKRFEGTLSTELNNADLYKLLLVEVPMNLSLCTHVDIVSDFDEYYKVQGMVSDITVIDSSRAYRPDDVVLSLLTRKDTTAADVHCGDFNMKFHSQGGYKKLMGCNDQFMAAVKRQFKERTIDQTELRRALPNMSLSLHCKDENPVYRVFKFYGMEFKNIQADMRTSKEEGIFGDVWIDSLVTQGYQLDTIKLKIGSKSNPNEIFYKGMVKNIQPNPYVFDVFFDGEVMEHGISLNTEFYDNKDELGLKLGAEAEMVEEGIRFHLTPKKPVIAYQPFHMSKENFILLCRNGKVKADVDLKADDGTGIQIYSTNNNTNEEETDEEDEGIERLQDLTVSVTQLNLGKLLGAIPYAPKANGMIYGDVHFVQEADESFSLSSDLEVRNMIYEGCKIGNLGSELVYMPKEDGSHYIDGHISLEGKEVGSITGAYNFETEKIDANLDFDKFPMEIVNGFIPDQIIGLEGTAEGELALHGTTSFPEVNGELFLENASLLSVPYGVKMRFDDDPIRIENSKLLFENFQMYASNNEPLVCMGSLDFANTEHMYLDLRMRAQNFLLIDSKETRRSEAYGQGYVNFYCMMKGELDKLQVRGQLDLLPSTNLYYILRDTPLTTDNRLKELVTFTDLSSDDQISVVRPTVDGLDVSLNINVKNGAHVKCWMNDAHTNYLDIIGEGDLKMKYIHDDIILNGRYTINEGEMKYSLPIIPLKTFTIEEGSYIEFNGDMMNPRLNITAKEETKAAVNINGADRMVKFETGVKISKTLSDMGLEFLIEAPEEQSIADELKMKSAEERGKLAVTLLTTGMYLSDGNTSNFSMNSALNSFLQSEINNLAGSALRTLDLSFGMDNSTEADGTMHTNYSFKFAKRFWNNRISISVGGKISTGPDVAGQNKSFFDNVEVQYRFSDVSNRYMRMFYKHSVYDYLEGYVGQYGAGYMWKKKMQSLSDLFHSTSNTLLIPRQTTTDTTRIKTQDTLRVK